ncbi:MAG: electron transport complex protein RnfA [Eubacteriales bacterium]
MGEILMIMLAAVITENFIFTKFLGICPFLGVSEKPSTAIGMGFSVIFVMTMSSGVTWLVYHLILKPFELEYMKTIAFILVIAALVQVIEMFIKKNVPALYSALGIYLPLITTNCAVLGSALLGIDREFDLIKNVIFGCFSGVGFTLAIVIFAGVRERLILSQPPEAFKGIPIALVTASLIAMAFTGFSGVSF